jgi:enoyl-[acyl-carrier protein] reductase I
MVHRHAAGTVLSTVDIVPVPPEWQIRVRRKRRVKDERERITMSEGLLTGKKGVVLGVANDKSIAWGCAKACADAGGSLYFNYLGDSLEKRVRKLIDDHVPGSPMAHCDVRSDEDIAAFFAKVKEEWGDFDFLIHSIAYADRDDLRDKYITTSRENFAMAMDVSAYSLVATAREAAPLMNEGGSIVTMTYFGSERVVPKYNVMGVAKAALEASARYLAYDLGADGIRVNALSAGPVRTLSASALAGMRKLLARAGEGTPMRRNITPDEVSKTCVYLVSDLASGVTGETLHVDCGFNIMGMPTPEEVEEK